MRKYLSYIFIFGFLFLIEGISFAQCPDVTASFTTSQQDICGPGVQIITFNNTSVGANNVTSNYEWSLNGVSFSNTSGLSNPGISNISTIGLYEYMLVVTDASVPCTDTAIVQVNIYPTPNSSFTLSPDNQCAGTTTINFNNNSTGVTGNTVYNWNFGNGGTSNAQNPNYIYPAGGTFNPTLTVVNGPGCTSSSSQTITTLPIPVINISGVDADGDLINCLLPADPSTTEIVTFSNATTGAVSYSWDFGDGSPIFNTNSLADFPHTYTAYGTYTVTMTATHANGCTFSQTLTVVFEKFVSAAMTLDITEYSGCTPHNLTTLSNLSVNANSYIWDFGDGTVITTTNASPPPHPYANLGTYTISLTAINSCNTAFSTIGPIIIVGGPLTSFNTGLAGNVGCIPQNVSVINTSTNTQPANNYQWNMGNGNTYSNTITPPVQTYNAPGVYPVELVAGNACGTDTVVINITITSPPIIDITSIPLDGCSPLIVATTNNTVSPPPINYSWFVDGVFQNSTPSLPDQTFTNNTSAPINHTIQLNGSNVCGSDSDVETITVHPITQANFTVSTDTICLGESILFTSNSLGETLTYNWDFGVSTDATQGPHNITYNSDGTFIVELTVNGFCGVDIVTQTIVVLPLPIADFDVDLDTGCVDLDVAIINNSTLGGNYSWSFIGGTPNSSIVYAPPPVNYVNSGTFDMILDVDLLGCTSSDTVVIQVNPLPIPSFSLLPDNGCTPLNVSFLNTSPINAGDNFDWNLGNGSVFNGQNPSDEIYITNSNDSLYTVELIITSSDGCIDSVESIITVHPLPIANYNILPDTACAGDAIAFLNNSIGASTFLWTFGDGGTDNINSPSHIYNQTGDLMSELIAITAFGCSDTIQFPVYIDSIPTAIFNFDVVCDIDTTHFTDFSTGSVTDWEWNFGDGSAFDNSISPTHFYGTSGAYNVVLTVTNPAGCTNTLSQIVNVSEVPIANFISSTTCLGSQAQFIDATSGIPSQWEWNFDDGSPIDNNQDPLHVYNVIGTYNVELVALAGNGCSDTISLPITVTPIPTANFNFSPVCIDDTTFFIDISTGNPDTYYWDFGDGFIDNTNNITPEHVYTIAGTYNVMLVAGYAASGCTDTINYTVDAHPRTVPNFSVNVPCFGSVSNFIDLTTGNPISWSWDFGDGSAIDNTQNPTHLYGAAGTYTIQLITENVFSCPDTLLVDVQVVGSPTANFTFNAACLNGNTNFSDNSISVALWEWNFDDGSAIDNSQSPSNLYGVAGDYNVELVVINAVGCTDTMVQLVTVNPNPIANFSASTSCHTYPSEFTDNSSGTSIYYWDFGDLSPIDNSPNPNYIYANPGNYTVEMIVENIFGCTDTFTQVVDVLIQPQAGFVANDICAGETATFSDTSTYSPTTWIWDFGDGSNLDNNQNTAHMYGVDGSYNVTLIVGNGSGCNDTTIVPINIFTVPIPNFVADTVCLFGITSFIDLSTDNVQITDWYWDYSDGNNSDTQNPTYIFQTPGSFNTQLTITNENGCDSSIILPVFVSSIPVANFIADTVCMGNPTNFNDLSTGFPTSWYWSFGDGNVSTQGPNTQHVYANPGSYIVTLIVDAGGSCTDQFIGIVEVQDNVTSGINVVDSICDGSQFDFFDNSTITSGTISSYSWDFGDGSTAEIEDVQYTYQDVGNYTVTHTVSTTGGCSSTTTIDVTVLDLPEAILSDLSACQNTPTIFTDLSIIENGVIDSWSWNFGDGSPISLLESPTHIYDVDGSYSLTLQVTSEFGCSSITTVPVVIFPAPNSDFNAPIGCPSDTIDYIDLSSVTSGSIVGWQWDFGDSYSSAIQNPQHAFQVLNDSFYVTLIATSNFGCTDTTTKLIETYPFAEFYFSPDWASGCSPYSVQFSDNSIVENGQITNWEWTFDDGSASFAQNPIHIFTEEGEYYVNLDVTTSDGCTYSDSLLYPIIVYPLPEAGFNPIHQEVSILEAEVQFTDISTDAINWEWYFGDGNYSNDVNPIHEYLDTGYFEVMQIVYTDHGCADTVIHSINVFGDFAVYVPNAFMPNSGFRNNTFRAYGMDVFEFEIWVFNRGGEQIWYSDDMEEEWDGTYQGNVVKDDVYVWKILCLDSNGNEYEYYGHVTILK